MIRPYNDTDKAALIDIFRRNAPEYFDPAELADYEKYLDEYASTYFTVEHEGKIAGGVGYFIDRLKKTGQITWILFHPQYTGMGLGKKVVEHCFAIFKADSGVEKLVVTTSQKAYRFFEKLGYGLVKTEENYWGPGLDLYLMERPL